MTRAKLEICVDTVGGAVAAIDGGADRIELCAALDVGGLTPSAGLTTLVLQVAGAQAVPVFAMVRPRAGDFTYDDADLALAVADARALLDLGVDGLVFGAGAAAGPCVATVGAWLSAVRSHAGPARPCTFHRAIDLADDPVAAVDTVAALGFDRILTSGGAVRAPDGAATIRAMVARAAGRIAIMPGSGVTPDSVADLARATGATEFHASASRIGAPVAAKVAALGFAVSPRRVTDADTVRGLRTALDGIHDRR